MKTFHFPKAEIHVFWERRDMAHWMAEKSLWCHAGESILKRSVSSKKYFEEPLEGRARESCWERGMWCWELLGAVGHSSAIVALVWKEMPELWECAQRGQGNQEAKLFSSCMSLQSPLLRKFQCPLAKKYLTGPDQFPQSRWKGSIWSREIINQ